MYLPITEVKRLTQTWIGKERAPEQFGVSNSLTTEISTFARSKVREEFQGIKYLDYADEYWCIANSVMPFLVANKKIPLNLKHKLMRFATKMKKDFESDLEKFKNKPISPAYDFYKNQGNAFYLYQLIGEDYAFKEILNSISPEIRKSISKEPQAIRILLSATRLPLRIPGSASTLALMKFIKTLGDIQVFEHSYISSTAIFRTRLIIDLAEKPCDIVYAAFDTTEPEFCLFNPEQNVLNLKCANHHGFSESIRLKLAPLVYKLMQPKHKIIKPYAVPINVVDDYGFGMQFLALVDFHRFVIAGMSMPDEIVKNCCNPDETDSVPVITHQILTNYACESGFDVLDTPINVSYNHHNWFHISNLM